jgi:uncharacterized protein
LLRSIVEHVETSVSDTGLQTTIGLTTNGVIPASRVVWLAEHVQDFCISLDGPAEVQDRHRPKLGGGPTFSEVLRTLELLERHGRHYYIECTLSSDSLDSLPALCALLAGHSGCDALFVEPAYPCGRFDGVRPPPEAFIEAFRAAEDQARRGGLALRYGSARTEILTSIPCWTPTPSFTVTPRGDVTACYMVTERSHPRADLFFHGRYDSATGRFAFDPEANARLRSRHVDNIPACRHCFCKYHCASGCLHQAPGLHEVDSYRCQVAKTLTADQLVRALGEPKRPG